MVWVVPGRPLHHPPTTPPLKGGFLLCTICAFPQSLFPTLRSDSDEKTGKRPAPATVSPPPPPMDDDGRVLLSKKKNQLPRQVQ